MGVINKKQTGNRGYLMKNDSLKGQYRINEQIRAKEVRIVGDEVEPNVSDSSGIKACRRA